MGDALNTRIQLVVAKYSYKCFWLFINICIRVNGPLLIFINVKPKIRI